MYYNPQDYYYQQMRTILDRVQGEAAAEELQNVSTQVYVPVPKNCCQSISVRNTSDQDIEVQNANLNIFRPDLSR